VGTPLHSLRRPCAILLVLAASLGGCFLAEPEAEFRFLNLEPETIDPGLVGGQAGGRIIANLFEGLTVRDPELIPQPGVAESWELSPDGLTWTFHLRESVWSDGTALVSEDFRWSWLRLLDPATASKSAQLLHPVIGAAAFNAGTLEDPLEVGIRAPGPQTLIVELERPVAWFAELCATPPLSPVPRHVIEVAHTRWTRPESIVSNGPFVLVERKLNQGLFLKRNARYWNVEEIALGSAAALTGDFANANFNRYESGHLDWVDAGGVPPSLVDRLRVRDDWHATAFLATYFLRCNVRRAPLDDPRVRRALQASIDARSIVDHVTRSGQVQAHSLVPPAVPGYEEIQLPGHDPERGRQLLAAAGYPGGEAFPAITLLISTSQWHRQIAEVLQQQWRDNLGIEVLIQNQEWKVFTATVRQGDYDLARGSWIADYADAGNFLEIWGTDSPNNRTGFADHRVDSLISRSAAEIDARQRAELLREIEQIVVAEEAAILPIYYFSITNLFDAEVWEGLEPDALNSLDLRRVRRRNPGPAR
jgi:oligopeptide transport system substrate-binding protein